MGQAEEKAAAEAREAERLRAIEERRLQVSYYI